MIAIQELIQKHKDMWQIIALETMKQKRKIQKSDYIDLDPSHRELVYTTNYCYACQAAYIRKININNNPDDPTDSNTVDHARCEYCPFIWPGKRCVHPHDSNGLYEQWLITPEYDYKRAAKLALKISKLKIKPNI